MISWPLSRRARKEIHPAFARNRELFREIDQKKPLDAYEFVVLDSELTGLDSEEDEIVSIGAVRIRDLRIRMGETFHAYVKPGRPLPKGSTLLHRITPQQVETAPGLAEVLPGFVEFCGGSFLVGHHVGLDISFLNRAAKELFSAALHAPCLDTMRLALAYREMTWMQYHDRFRMNVSYNLADLAREYGLPAFARHDALEDALQTAYLFLFLVKKMKEQGIVTLKDLFHAGQRWIY